MTCTLCGSDVNVTAVAFSVCVSLRGEPPRKHRTKILIPCAQCWARALRSRCECGEDRWVLPPQTGVR